MLSAVRFWLHHPQRSRSGGGGGTVVVEVLAPRTPGQVATLPGFPPIGGDPDAPARLAGLVVTVPSLEPVGELLGEDALGYPRPAAQGRSPRSPALFRVSRPRVAACAPLAGGSLTA